MHRRVRAMTCRGTTTALQRYLDEEMDPDTAWSVTLHLAGCDPCIEELRAVQRVSALVARLRLAPDPMVIRRLRAVLGRHR
ncbi:hypothetical protein BH23ACT9_BH23ACT9_34590 [soil metagenome]